MLTPKNVYATHVAGADLVYEHISGNTYKIIYNYYYLCGYTHEPDTVSCCWYSSCNPTAINSVTLTKGPFPWYYLISRACYWPGTTCNSHMSTVPGFAVITFSATVTLPTQCNFWTFYVVEAARSTNINNLVTPGGQGVYVQTTLNNLTVLNNSSPYFAEKPMPFCCAGVPFTYNNSAVDPDGDSLSYELATPLNGGYLCQANAVPIAFSNTIYNLTNNPISCNNTFSINSQTGTISFTPNIQQCSVIAILVKEWRNGQLIGTVTRDMQIIVYPCNNPYPTLNIIQNTLSNATLSNGQITICANDSGAFCFDIVSPDSTAQQHIEDNRLSTIPASSIVYSGILSDSVRGCVSWTPSSADVGQHMINITSSGCYSNSAISIATTFTIIINVIPPCGPSPIITVANNSNYCSTDCKPVAPLLTLQGSATSLINGAKVYFGSGYVMGEDILSMPTIGGLFGTFDTITGVLTVNGTASPTQFEAALRTVCYQNIATAQTLGLREIFFSIGKAIYNPHNGHFYELIDNGTNIISWDSARRAASYSYLYGTRGYLLTITNQQENDFCTQKIHSNSWLGCSDAAHEGYWRWVTGCECREDTGQGRLFFTSNATTPCNSGSGTTNNGNYNNWLAGQPDNCSGGQPIFENYGYFMMGSPAQNGKWADLKNNDSVTKYIIEYGCLPNDPILQIAGKAKLTVIPHPVVTITPANAAICDGDSITLVALGVGNYTWSPANSLNTSVGSTVVASPTSSTVYTITYIDTNGCQNIGTKKVDVTPTPTITANSNSPICEMQQLILNATSSATSGDFAWFGVDGFTSFLQNPVLNNVRPSQSGIYKVFTTFNNCESDTASVNVVVTAQPNVNAGGDKEITEASSAFIDATATNATKYLWTPSEGLNCNDCLQPVATPIKTTTYVVTAYNEYCTATDTINVRVICNDNSIFMPNTFTPNADGLNDRLYPQRRGNGLITSFRVFSRWGEKLFEVQNVPANDDTYGWDGTSNGKPVTSDVYIFVINAYCESGEPIEVRGDITLVR